MKQRVYALVDCASFYVSCEKAFAAVLHNRPTVVLSNNDGCIVALDSLAKKIGLKRGQPVFKQQELLRKYDVQVFSSYYTLYQEMSARVMNVLAEFSPRLENYSIDEGWISPTWLSMTWPSWVTLSKRGSCNLRASRCASRSRRRSA